MEGSPTGKRITTMQVRVEQVTEEATLSLECACGGCHPTATVYRGDLGYERHDPHLGEGPCCCGRFFVVGPDALSHAEAMAKEPGRQEGAPGGYEFRRQEVPLPWGGTIPAVVAELRA